MPRARKLNHRRRGAALILSMIFVLIFSALAVSFASLTGTNVQVASNQHRVKTALDATQSGPECAKYIVSTINLGNTNPQQNDNNVLTGAIVGGIVDVHGNAQIYGTIISMFDTTPYSSGYVTNIGATLDDGGSETTELGDIGTIDITPEGDMMLPSGIISPIVIRTNQTSYCESA